MPPDKTKFNRENWRLSFFDCSQAAVVPLLKSSMRFDMNKHQSLYVSLITLHYLTLHYITLPFFSLHKVLLLALRCAYCADLNSKSTVPLFGQAPRQRHVHGSRSTRGRKRGSSTQTASYGRTFELKVPATCICETGATAPPTFRWWWSKQTADLGGPDIQPLATG